MRQRKHFCPRFHEDRLGKQRVEHENEIPRFLWLFPWSKTQPQKRNGGHFKVSKTKFEVSNVTFSCIKGHVFKFQRQNCTVLRAKGSILQCLRSKVSKVKNEVWKATILSFKGHDFKSQRPRFQVSRSQFKGPKPTNLSVKGHFFEYRRSSFHVWRAIFSKVKGHFLKCQGHDFKCQRSRLAQ